ncbi:MAG TPA: NAD-dependent epimerase/dehydratase family protein, partial [Chitinophagaceae bacterium]|nr:NAD-dependent epimerase/dehydratase family protein [Chitinophagaceae bacterium]
IKRPSSNISAFNDLAVEIQWVEASMTNVDELYDALEGIDTIYHCAAQIGYTSSDTDAMYKINKEGTANLVNAALHNKVTRLLYVSSIAAIGANPDLGMIREESKWEKSKLNTHYSISKMLGELEVWRGMAEGLSCVIINPGIILGPAKWEHGVGRIWKHVDSGSMFYVDNVNGYIDVRDVVQIMVELMKSGINGQRYILVAENAGIKQIIDLVAQKLNKRPPSIKLDPALLPFIAGIEAVRTIVTGSSPIITPTAARLASKNFTYSNQKIRDCLQYDFIPLRETVDFVTKAYVNKKHG